MGKRGSFRANVLRLEDVDPTEGFPSSDPAFFDHLVLAEGDSWFSIGGFPPSNLLYGLRFRRHTMVVSCAAPGDTIVKMSNLVGSKQFRQALSADGYAWDVILLSGGGNDLIDAAKRVVLMPSERSSAAPSEPEEYINEDALGSVLTDIAKGFKVLAELRDAAQSPAQGKPIVTHTYDYATPRNEPARFIGFPVKGPWLFKSFTSRKVPQEHWIPLANHLMDRLAETIIDLQSGPHAIENFHVVDTRGTLTQPRLTDIGPTTHWLNEIHPNHDGHSRLARQLERGKLYELLYGAF